MLAPRPSTEPVSDSFTITMELPLFGLRKGSSIHYQPKQRYGLGEVVLVEAVASGKVTTCVNYVPSSADHRGSISVFLMPVSPTSFKWLVGTPDELRVLGSVIECHNMRVGLFTPSLV